MDYTRLEDYKVWERGDGFCIYSFDNFKLWFGVNNELEQIGVTKGFFGTYNSVRIGTTMLDIKKIFGRYENEGLIYRFFQIYPHILYLRILLCFDIAYNLLHTILQFNILKPLPDSCLQNILL